MNTTNNKKKEMISEMTLKYAVEDLKKEVEMETWRRAEEMVVMKAEIIANLLQSDESRNIRYLSMGERFRKLNVQRTRLYIIQLQLYSMADKFHQEWCKAVRK